MSAYDNEQIRQMGKALNEYSHAMSELAEAEEIDGRLIMTSPIKELCIGAGVPTEIFWIGFMIWAWIDGERGFGFLGGDTSCYIKSILYRNGGILQSSLNARENHTI